MPARATRGARRPVEQVAPVARAKRSRTLLAWLAGSFGIILTTLIVLRVAGVRLGQGYFATLWSPLFVPRLTRVVTLMPAAAMACGAVWALTVPRRSYRATGRILLVLAAVGAGVWIWSAPPE